MFKYHTRCRACGHTELTPVFNLGVQPLANAFGDLGTDHPGFAPLEVLFCRRCTLAQLSVVVDPAVLYSHYNYVTSRSQTMREHFQLLWSEIRKESKVESVVEIGSNDGLFMRFCRENGANTVLGIDPAENLKPGRWDGIYSIVGVFNKASAAIARTVMPPVDVIVARHVFAHVDDWRGFLGNLYWLSQPETLVVIEVPYAKDTLENVEFDQLYHEHLSFISLKSIEALLEGSPFHLDRVLRFDIHGGAIVLMLRRNDSNNPPETIISDLLQAEHITVDSWYTFSAGAHTNIAALRQLVAQKVYGEGAKVCGFGASAKSTVWVNACRFNHNELSFICDSTPQKQGKLSPGTQIPIVDEGTLLREQPDYAICFAWNFFREICCTQSEYLKRGGKFIVPVPDVRIVGEEKPEREPVQA